MILGFEYILKITIGCLIFFIVAKHLFPVMFEALYNKLFKAPKRNNDVDFDLLVERKKSMLRSGETSTQGNLQDTAQKNYESKTHESYAKEYKFLSSDPEKNKEECDRVKKVLIFLDQLQWGSSKEITSQIKSLSSNFDYRFELTDFSEIISFTLQNDILLKLKTPGLPSLEAIISYVSLGVIKKQFYLDTQNKSGPLLNKVARKFSCDLNSAALALTHIIFRTINPSWKIDNLFSDSELSPSREEFFSYLEMSSYSEDQKSFQLKKDFFLEVENLVHLFDSISPLPEIHDKSSLEEAFDVMGISSDSSVDKIKKQYKKLAKLKHPDTLSSKGLPDSFSNLANENFTKIKTAYDLIVKSKK